MTYPLSRRDVLKTLTASALTALPAGAAPTQRQKRTYGIVEGRMTGAEAIVETLLQEHTSCVFGIPGAQGNELWDTMKTRGLDYVLVTHEFSAATMADGYARTTGRPGVICVIPGPGVTNALTGIGEALLDSIPMVCIVGDVARGDKYRAFQIHELPQAGLLRQVTKETYEVQHPGEIADTIRRAFQTAKSGEPGPVAVVIPSNFLIEECKYHSPELAAPALPCDDTAIQQAINVLHDKKQRVGIYAGQGCMEFTAELAAVADLLQAPVATSVSGKSVILDSHPLAVGWGYGPQGTCCAEETFKKVDVVLAIGVKYSEVSTGFYSIPKHKCVIHVDINPTCLGRNVPNAMCVNSDAGLFLGRVLAEGEAVRRCLDVKLANQIQQLKAKEDNCNNKIYATCGCDAMAFVLALRRQTRDDVQLFVDVTTTEHWAAEAFTVKATRSYFNPTNNQAMGWSVAASLGAQKAWPGRQTVTITGDGCFLMSAMEISTAARERLPVKFFVLDDQAYHIMQAVQMPAYRRTTATILSRLDYEALAKGFGVAYQEILRTDDLDSHIRGVLDHDGPVLTRVYVDYAKRPLRWMEAVRKRYTQELSTEQKVRFAARLGSRAMSATKDND